LYCVFPVCLYIPFILVCSSAAACTNRSWIYCRWLTVCRQTFSDRYSACSILTQLYARVLCASAHKIVEEIFEILILKFFWPIFAARCYA